MKLYDNGFSPFARKVRMVLGLKGLAYETVDGLDKSNAKALRAVNGRVEVPTLVDGDVKLRRRKGRAASSAMINPSR